MQLGSCRFQLEQFSAAIKPLRRATQLLTPDEAPHGGVHLQDTLWLLIQVSPRPCEHFSAPLLSLPSGCIIMFTAAEED